MAYEDFGFSISSILNFELENSRVRPEPRAPSPAPRNSCALPEPRTPNPDLRKFAVRILAFVLWLAVPTRLSAATVRAWEGALDLPTYALGEEDPNPAFPLI